MTLGELNLAEGEAPAAVACLEGSVRLWRTGGWTPFLARTLRVLGDAHAAAGDHAPARAAWAEAGRLCDGDASGADGGASSGCSGANVDLPV